MDSKGITKTKITKIGNNASDTAQIFFDNVRVPRKNIIGEEGKGFTYQMLQFQEERMWGVASGTIDIHLILRKVTFFFFLSFNTYGAVASQHSRVLSGQKGIWSSSPL